MQNVCSENGTLPPKPCPETSGLAKKKNNSQMRFYSTFEEQLDHEHPLYILANKIDWHKFETSFSKHYSETMGAPAKPIRLMVSLLILKSR